MKITLQIVVEHEDLETPLVEEVACICRGDLLPETMGLTLDEGKQILTRLQQHMVQGFGSHADFFCSLADANFHRTNVL